MDSNNETKKSQEIDLSYLYKSFLYFFNALELVFYKGLRFVLKNIVTLFVLSILGVVLGYFLDKEKQLYKHEIIIKTNFDSASYLYKKIANSVFYNDLNNDGIKNITIKPIIDVLSFTEEGSRRLEIAKYLSANNINISEYKEGGQTELIYKYHTLCLYTKEKDTDSQIVMRFLKKLNQNSYYIKAQKTQQQQTATIIEEFQKSVNLINAYIENNSTSEASVSSTFKIATGGISDLIIQKNQLLTHLETFKKQQIEEEKIFFDISIFPNIYAYNTSVLDRKALHIPILFVFGYLFLLGIIKRYKKHILLAKENN